MMSKEKIDKLLVQSEKIRKCNICIQKCIRGIINIPQPIFINSDEILIIGQNPATPRQIKSDEVLTYSRDIYEFMNAYEESLKTSRFSKYIKEIGLTFEDISIVNVVKCPTKKNAYPDNRAIAQCIPYLKEQIDIIQPKIILVMGGVAKHHYNKMLEKYPDLHKYIFIGSDHYSRLMRLAKFKEECAIIREQLIAAREYVK